MESENIDKELAELEAALEQEENLQKEKAVHEMSLFSQRRLRLFFYEAGL